ncbi:MAG: hypothetical protein ACK56C_08360 [Alphaproteobacteria bacterium]
MDSIGGRDRDGVRIPRHFTVDVGATFSTKQAMLAQHQSQADWVAKQHGIVDHLADMVAWTRRVGRDAGVEYAEGFRQYLPKATDLSPLIQDDLNEIAERLNNRPRKILDFMTPNEVFQQLINSTNTHEKPVALQHWGLR